jgi:GTP-binding protein EngB required for normal cell division
MTKIVNSNSSVIETPTKNILIIGKTGNGKSTLANVLANTSSFAESSGSTSQTKSVQAQVFEHQQQAYQVIDTLGLSDTSLTEKEVLLKIAEIAEYLQDGNLCQVLFVIDKRISKEEREVYRLLQEVILADNDTKNLVTLVRSNFVGFEDQTAINQDLEHIKQQPALAEILTNSRDIIYLNNPSLDTSQRQSAQ